MLVLKFLLKLDEYSLVLSAHFYNHYKLECCSLVPDDTELGLYCVGRHALDQSRSAGRLGMIVFEEAGLNRRRWEIVLAIPVVLATADAELSSALGQAGDVTSL